MKDKTVKFFKSLDRSLFIDNEFKKFADLDRALPIGHDQTISQPSLVLEMTQRLELDSKSKVLEIGTGSGYQTAFLAEFSREVYTIERIEELGVKARKRLESLGYKNISYKIGDGSFGWKEYSPFDRIIVTAAANDIPSDLVKQLAANGIMIAPVGPRYLQELKIITKNEKGDVHTDTISNVVFVEMKGKYGWSK